MTGWSTGLSTDNDFATVAYDTTTGQELWAKRYDGPGDYIERAYDADTGDQLWFKRYNGPGDFSDSARSLAVTPDGTRVLVNGPELVR